VPPKSAQVLNDAVGSKQNEFVLIEGAHVGIMIDPRSRPLWTRMSDFLKAGTQTPRKERASVRVGQKAGKKAPARGMQAGKPKASVRVGKRTGKKAPARNPAVKGKQKRK